MRRDRDQALIETNNRATTFTSKYLRGGDTHWSGACMRGGVWKEGRKKDTPGDDYVASGWDGEGSAAPRTAAPPGDGN